MKYDLHMHTHYSKCSNLKPERILRIARRKGLNGIAITDHQEIAGALEAKRLNRAKNFEVIIGEEISTNFGDVLVYYLNKKIYAVNFFDVIEEAKKQNALVVIPHPFRRTLINNHKFRFPLKEIKGKINAIECFNARMLFNSDNKKADFLSERLKIAKTGGSDAHFFFEIGNGYTIFDGDLRRALKERITRVGGTTLFGPIGGLFSYLKKNYLSNLNKNG